MNPVVYKEIRVIRKKKKVRFSKESCHKVLLFYFMWFHVLENFI